MSDVHAGGHLLWLWASMAEHAEDGNLTKIDDQVIESWAGWDGEPNRFLAALRATGWIVDGVMVGFEKRHREMVAERNRKAAYRKRQRDISGTRSPCPTGQTRDTVALSHGTSLGQDRPVRRDCPSRAHAGVTGPDLDRTVPTTTSPPGAPASPPEVDTSPSPKVTKPKARRSPGDVVPDPPPEVAELWAAFLAATRRTADKYTLTGRRVAELKNLVAWAGSMDAAKRGIAAVGASPHHRGENDTGTRYDGLEDKPFRTREAFEGWVEKAAPPVVPPLPPQPEFLPYDPRASHPPRGEVRGWEGGPAIKVLPLGDPTSRAWREEVRRAQVLRP